MPFVAPDNSVVLGVPNWRESMKTNGATQKPGHIVKRNASTSFKTDLAGLLDPILGVLHFDGSADQPDTRDTAYADGDEVEVVNGPDIDNRLRMAFGFKAVERDPFIPWAAGEVAVGEADGHSGWFKHPFDKQASEKDAGVILPDGFHITNAYLDVSLADGSGTVDSGIFAGDTEADPDGFLDAIPATAVGLSDPDLTAATAAAIQLGVLLQDPLQSDGAGDFHATKKPYLTNGGAQNLSWTTSNFDIAGDIIYEFEAPGVRTLGTAREAIDASVVGGASVGAAVWARRVA